MRRCRLGVFLLVSCLALGGCWDERPIEQLSFVTLAAFDGTPGHVQAYLEATDAATGVTRKQVLEKALVRYCARDTEAIMRLTTFLSQS